MRVPIFLLVVMVFSCAAAAEYTSPYGEWRGQTQYQAFIRAVSDPAAHTVTDLVIRIDSGGKVVGTSVENGCRMLGLSSPGVVPTSVTLDVTIRGCVYDGYNRTYHGYLSIHPKERFGKFALRAVDVGSGRAGSYNIDATMRR